MHHQKREWLFKELTSFPFWGNIKTKDYEHESNKWHNRDVAVSIETIQGYEERCSLPVIANQAQQTNEPDIKHLKEKKQKTVVNKKGGCNQVCILLFIYHLFI